MDLFFRFFSYTEDLIICLVCNSIITIPNNRIKCQLLIMVIINHVLILKLDITKEILDLILIISEIIRGMHDLSLIPEITIRPETSSGHYHPNIRPETNSGHHQMNARPVINSEIHQLNPRLVVNSTNQQLNKIPVVNSANHHLSTQPLNTQPVINPENHLPNAKPVVNVHLIIKIEEKRNNSYSYVHCDFN